MCSTYFNKKHPCKSCPYRIDAPRQLWSREEFIDLLRHERSTMGVTYGCHKKDEGVCAGWLINQDNRGFPSIALRIKLSKDNIDRTYLDSLSCSTPMFETVEEMCEANYPGITKKITP